MILNVQLNLITQSKTYILLNLTLIRLRGTASASYGQGREFEPRFVPHRTIFEKDTFTVSRGLPVAEQIKMSYKNPCRTQSLRIFPYVIGTNYLCVTISARMS